MSVVHLSEAERRLRLYDPAKFDSDPFGGPECLEWVRLVEDSEAWRNAYPSLEDFYAEHESRHPDIRLYGRLRRQIETEDPLRSDGGTIRVRLARLREEAAGRADS